MTNADGSILSISRVIFCSHPDYPKYSKDFSELWIGATDEKPGASDWKGGFRGRPALAQELWPDLQDALHGKKPKAFNSAISALRNFWRFLEAYECRGFAPIVEVADITSGLAVLWLNPIDEGWNPCNSSSNFDQVGRLVRRARERLQLQNAWVWISFPRNRTPVAKDLPSDAQVRASMVLLKQTAYAIYRRWEHADAMAATGRNLLDVPRNMRSSNAVPGRIRKAFDFDTTEADAHATFRAMIVKSGNPLPSRREFFKSLGLQGDDYPRWWPKHDKNHPSSGQVVRYETLIAGLYPTQDDIDCLSLLCMARSGWNPATVYAIDISTSNWATVHGEAGSPLWLIQAFKERAKAWQWTLSPERLSTGFHFIVSALIRRTLPLRTLIEHNRNLCNTPSIAFRSPWVSVTRCSESEQRVTTRNETNAGGCLLYWKQLVREYNECAAPGKLITASISPSDWRDIYASRVFQDSRYSWVLVQWALGHKHMASTRHYLRRLLWRRYSEKKLHDLQILLIDGIEAHARVDATILRAQIDLGCDPSSADLARLETHRRVVRERELSYSGYGCLDRYHPPKEIDPSNPHDGSSPCGRGDRCPSCPLAQAIDARHMAKRLAELSWLSRQVNATIWLESHYAADLEVLRSDLKQWPAEEINGLVSYWESEIQAGRHKVIRFGGMQ